MRHAFWLLFLLFSGSAHAQWKTLRLNNDATLTANELNIAISPRHPAEMLAGANINLLFRSDDGGLSWQQRGMKSSLGIWGDPVVYADDSGYFYYCHLSRTAGKSFPQYIDRMVVQRSTDGGISFNDGVAVGYNEGRAQDKEWICGDMNARSPYYGNLYLSWTEFDAYGSREPEQRSRIRLSVSANRGLSFNNPVTVSDLTGDCLDGDSTTEGATVAVGPAGEVYVAWSLNNKIYFDCSRDGGRTFGNDQVIAEQVGGWDIPVSGIFRANGMPFLLCDNSEGPYRGTLYICWADTRSGHAEVYLSRSVNQGKNWTAPVCIGCADDPEGRDRFSPNVCIDQSNGHVYVVYYNRRHSPSSHFMDVYMACSRNGGLSFSQRRATEISFPMPDKRQFFGDYIGVAAWQNSLRAVWTEARHGQLDARVLLAHGHECDDSLQGQPATRLSELFVAEAELWMHFYMDRPESVKLIVKSKGGKKYVQFAYELTAGEQEMSLVLPPLPEGEYVLELAAGKKKQQRTFFLR